MADENDGRATAEDVLASYWRANLRVTALLLGVWAVAGLGLGVLFADALNAYRMFGFPLGFWIAQQGAIVVFVLLILVYAMALDRLDATHHEDLRGVAARDRESRA